MAAMSNTVTLSRLAGLGAALGRLAGGVVAAAAGRWRARRDLRHLSKVDDRLLADVGLERWMVGDAVVKGRLPSARLDPRCNL